MRAAVDLLLSRLENPKRTGIDRWRSACPVCGGKNHSTLSIGVADNGAALVKCFKTGCGPDEIAAAVGLDLQDLFPPSESSGRRPRRRRLLSGRQALEVAIDEITFAIVVISDTRRGITPDQDTFYRLLIGLARLIELREEVDA